MSEFKDQQWELVQEKAFTAWMNETLAPSGIRITDLRVDLADGVKLAQFFQILSGKKIHTKIETRPVTRIQKIQNLHIALTFLEAEMLVRNPGCSAEYVVDAGEPGGKIKMILGLLWIIYRRFRIATISVQDKSSEEGLLLWVKQATSSYSEVHIESFKTSFRDGMAFVALVHSFNPDKTKIDLSHHSKNTPEHNLSVAFELAEQELGIPKLLDTKEVFEGRVDERSLVLYTSLFFHAFKAAEAAKDLTRAKLSTEETLAEERRKNEELKQQNLLLIAQLEDIKLHFDDLSRKKLELTQQFEEEKNEITLSLHHKEEKTLQLQRQVEEKAEETLKLHHDIEEKTEETLKLQRLVREKSEISLNFQQKFFELQQILEEERSETSLRLEDYQKKNLELSEQLHEEQTRRLDLESKVSDLSSSLNENQETNLQVITELRKKQGLYEEEIESLKNDVENFKAQLDNERRENNQHHQALQERTEQDTFHRKGLQVLHKNLDEHIADLHTWQKYLDSKDRNWLDFDRDVRPSLNNELGSRNDFIEELNLLSDKLESENEIMLQILKVKMAEAKNTQIDAAKDTKR